MSGALFGEDFPEGLIFLQGNVQGIFWRERRTSRNVSGICSGRIFPEQISFHGVIWIEERRRLGNVSGLYSGRIVRAGGIIFTG